MLGSVEDYQRSDIRALFKKNGLTSKIMKKEKDPLRALQMLMNRRQTDSSISSNITSMKERIAGGLVNAQGIRRHKYE